MKAAKLITSLPFAFFTGTMKLKGLRERTKTRKIESYNLKQFLSNYFLTNLLRAPTQPFNEGENPFFCQIQGNSGKAKNSPSKNKYCKLPDLVKVKAISR